MIITNATTFVHHHMLPCYISSLAELSHSLFLFLVSASQSAWRERRTSPLVFHPLSFSFCTYFELTCHCVLVPSRLGRAKMKRVNIFFLRKRDRKVSKKRQILCMRETERWSEREKCIQKFLNKQNGNKIEKKIFFSLLVIAIIYVFMICFSLVHGCCRRRRRRRCCLYYMTRVIRAISISLFFSLCQLLFTVWNNGENTINKSSMGEEARYIGFGFLIAWFINAKAAGRIRRRRRRDKSAIFVL